MSEAGRQPAEMGMGVALHHNCKKVAFKIQKTVR